MGTSFKAPPLLPFTLLDPKVSLSSVPEVYPLQKVVIRIKSISSKTRILALLVFPLSKLSPLLKHPALLRSFPRVVIRAIPCGPAPSPTSGFYSLKGSGFSLSGSLLS